MERIAKEENMLVKVESLRNDKYIGEIVYVTSTGGWFRWDSVGKWYVLTYPRWEMM